MKKALFLGLSLCLMPAYAMATVSKPTTEIPRTMHWVDYRTTPGVLSPYDGLLGNGNHQIILFVDQGKLADRKQILIAGAFVATHPDVSIILKDIVSSPEGDMISRTGFIIRAISGDDTSKWKNFLYLMGNASEINQKVIDEALVKSGVSPERVKLFAQKYKDNITSYFKSIKTQADKLVISKTPTWLAGEERINGYMLVKNLAKWTGE